MGARPRGIAKQSGGLQTRALLKAPSGKGRVWRGLPAPKGGDQGVLTDLCLSSRTSC